jgi:thiol-disulfide isomerase/thioredoxin
VLYIGVMAKASLSVTIFVWLISALATAQEAAPSLELRDLKGAPHKLADYRGKPVVLNFWATWCVPCAVEMPLLSEMQKRYQGRVLFIAASIDDEDMKPHIEAFIKKHQGDALTVMMGATLDSLEDFGVNQGMPGTVFIDAEGKIVDRFSGALKRTDLQKRLRKLTGEPEPEPTPTPIPKAAKKKPVKSSGQKLVPSAQESSGYAF